MKDLFLGKSLVVPTLKSNCKIELLSVTGEENFEGLRSEVKTSFPFRNSIVL